ncbi:MAG: DUF1651 domain-containing protein [Cyanobacteria bacterium]|nr:DUF1651 domain-containing protein [Cyanobacteriota bacterium]
MHCGNCCSASPFHHHHPPTQRVSGAVSSKHLRELLPDQEIPLLKSRRELNRAEALKLWQEKRKAGWTPCNSQW